MGNLIDLPAQPRRMAKSYEGLLRENNFPQAYSGDSVVQEMTERLAKALTNAGYPLGTTDMTSLRLQNLDATMTSVLFTMQHLKLFNSIPRVPSIQPLFEYNVRLAYGGGRSSAGFAEGGSPVGSTSQYARRNATVRYLGVRGGISHQAMQTGLLGGAQVDPVEEENRNRTMELLEKVERLIMFGSSAITDLNGQNVNYDGFLIQMGALGNGVGTVAPNNVLDMKGVAPSFDIFEKVAERLYTNAYVPSVDGYNVFTSPGVLSDLSALRVGIGSAVSNTYQPTIQRHFNNDNAGVMEGMPMLGYQSNYGAFQFQPTLFLQRTKNNRPLLAANEDTQLTVADAGAPAAPAAPTMAAATDTATNLPLSTAYYYVAAAFNDAGESLGVVSAASVTTDVATKQHVTVTVPRVTGATGYRIYRTDPSMPGAGGAGDANGVNARWIADVPQPGSGNATYVDTNQIIPGTGMMIFMRPDVEDVVMAQMSPLIKFPIAIVSTMIEFFLLLYHVLVVKAPVRHFVVKNIGRLIPQ